jgi:hypothetical protein
MFQAERKHFSNMFWKYMIVYLHIQLTRTSTGSKILCILQVRKTSNLQCLMFNPVKEADFQQPNEDPSTTIHSSMRRRTSTGEFIVTTADMVMASNEHHLKIQRITLIILPLLLFSTPCTLPFFSASFISTDMENKRLSEEFGSSLTWYISDKLLNI